jgi:hypothetical protein
VQVVMLHRALCDCFNVKPNHLYFPSPELLPGLPYLAACLGRMSFRLPLPILVPRDMSSTAA